MPEPHPFLKANPLNWLLEKENPSVRFWSLVDILKLDTDDPQVAGARAAVAQQALVKTLFDLQHPEGHWGEDKTKPYTTQGAIGVLALLHILGVEPDERTSAGCHSCLTFCQNENGGFSLTRTRRSGIFPCTTGEHLPAMVYFGLGDDPRIRAAFDFLIADMAKDHALHCGRYQHRECLWGAIAALNGLAVLPGDMRTDFSNMVVQRMADALLNAPYDFAGEHKRWLTFGVPRVWDLLSALNALAAHGYTPDPRFMPLLERIRPYQDERGCWPCGSVSRTWPLEKRNRPSKWVTLDVLRMLKRMDASRYGIIPFRVACDAANPPASGE